MSILVTGGTGAIGCWVVRDLIARGEKPIIFDIRTDFRLLNDIREKVIMFAGDILNKTQLIEVIKENGVSAIIHLAAMMPPQAQANPYLGFKVNGEGTVSVLESAKQSGVRRVVYASSKAIYGKIDPENSHPQYHPVDEDYRKRPNNVYGVTKLFGEHMGEQYYSRFGVEFVALRFASTYGPGKQERHGEVSFLSKIIEDSFKGLEVKIEKGGDQKNDILYNRDAANAIVQACFSKGKIGVYNIGSGYGISLKEFANEVGKVIPGAKVNVGPGLIYGSTTQLNYCVYDITRAREDLGFEPDLNLKQNIEDYVKWLGILKI